MKKLLLLASLLVSGLTSFAQGDPDNPNHDTDPGPYKLFICDRFCFTNNTNCYNYICVNSNMAKDACTGDFVEAHGCVSLEAGQSGCIELKSRSGCKLCPETYSITVCGNNSYPCFTFTNGQTIGQGVINCGGPYEVVKWKAIDDRKFETTK